MQCSTAVRWAALRWTVAGLVNSRESRLCSWASPCDPPASTTSVRRGLVEGSVCVAAGLALGAVWVGFDTQQMIQVEPPWATTQHKHAHTSLRAQSPVCALRCRLSASLLRSFVRLNRSGRLMQDYENGQVCLVAPAVRLCRIRARCRCGMEFRRSNCLQRQGLAHCTERCCTAAFALLRIRLIALAMQGGSPDVGREPLHQFQDDLHAHPVRARATACERLRSEQQPVMSRCVALCMCSQYMPRWRRTQVHLHGPVIESSSF